MTVLDVVSQYLGTDAVFRRYDALAGECICCFNLFETLDGLCRKYGFDVDKLIEEILEAIVHSASPEPRK